MKILYYSIQFDHWHKFEWQIYPKKYIWILLQWQFQKGTLEFGFLIFRRTTSILLVWIQILPLLWILKIYLTCFNFKFVHKFVKAIIQGKSGYVDQTWLVAWNSFIDLRITLSAHTLLIQKRKRETWISDNFSTIPLPPFVSSTCACASY